MWRALNIFLFVFYFAEGVVFENRCQLFKELTETYKVAEEEAAIWTCIAEGQSAYNSGKRTESIGEVEQTDYGLFQVKELIFDLFPPTLSYRQKRI